MALKPKKVRTPEGAKFYGLPIGSIITPDVIAKLEGARKRGKYLQGQNGGSNTTPPNRSNFKSTSEYNAAKKKFQETGSLAPIKSSDTPETYAKVAESAKIKGPKKFTVGQNQYGAPLNSKIIKTKNDDGTALTFVVTPEGDLHAFINKGELELSPKLMQLFQAKFGKDFAGDDKYDLGEFDDDQIDVPEFDDIPVGTDLLDENGDAIFTKNEDDTYTLKALNVKVDPKEIQPLYDSGELVPDPKKLTPKLADMEKDDFELLLNGLPVGSKLIINKGQAEAESNLIKQDNGNWLPESATGAGFPGTAPSQLYFVKNSLTLENPEGPAPVKKTQYDQVKEILDSELAKGNIDAATHKVAVSSMNARANLEGSPAYLEANKAAEDAPEVDEEAKAAAEEIAAEAAEIVKDIPTTAPKTVKSNKVTDYQDFLELPVGSRVKFDNGMGNTFTYEKKNTGTWDDLAENEPTQLKDSSFSESIQKGFLFKARSARKPKPKTAEDLKQGDKLTDIADFDLAKPGTVFSLDNGIGELTYYKKDKEGEWEDTHGFALDDEDTIKADIANGQYSVDKVMTDEEIDAWVTSMDDLDALPTGSVITDNDGLSSEKYIKNADGEWVDGVGDFVSDYDLINAITDGHITKERTVMDVADIPGASDEEEESSLNPAEPLAGWEKELMGVPLAIGDTVPNTEWMKNSPDGTVVTYSDLVDYTKLPNGNVLDQHGAQHDINDLSISSGKFKIKSLPPAMTPKTQDQKDLDALKAKLSEVPEPPKTYVATGMWELDEAVADTKIEVTGPMGNTEILHKTDDGFWINENGYEYDYNSPFIKNAVDKGKVKIYDKGPEVKGTITINDDDELPEDFEDGGIPPKISEDGVLQEWEKELLNSSNDWSMIGGSSFTKAEIQSALDALENHSGFQIFYPLKAINSPLAKVDFESVAKAHAPNKKPKAAFISKLKSELGIEEEKKFTPNPNAPKVAIGGKDNPEFGVDEIQHAIEVLENYQGKQFKVELDKNDSALATAKFDQLVGIFKDKNEGKQALIAYFKNLVPEEKWQDDSEQTSNDPDGFVAGQKLKAEDMAKLPIGSVVSSGLNSQYEKISNDELDAFQSKSTKNKFELELFENENYTLHSLPGNSDLPAYAQTPEAIKDKNSDDPDVAPVLEHNAAGILPGKYTVGDAYFANGNAKAYMIVNADGTGLYVFSKEKGTKKLSPAAVKKNYDGGMQTYHGVVDSDEAVIAPIEEESSSPEWAVGDVLKPDDALALPVGYGIGKTSGWGSEHTYTKIPKNASGNEWDGTNGHQYDSSIIVSSIGMNEGQYVIKTVPGEQPIFKVGDAITNKSVMDSLPVGSQMKGPYSSYTKTLPNADGDDWLEKNGEFSYVSDNFTQNSETGQISEGYTIAKLPEGFEAAPSSASVNSVPTPTKTPKVKKPSKKPATVQELADGTYYLGLSSNPSTTVLHVKDGKVQILKSGETDTDFVPLTKIKTPFSKGEILDENGHSILPKDYTGKAYYFGVQTTVPALAAYSKYLDELGEGETPSSAAIQGFGVYVPAPVAAQVFQKVYGQSIYEAEDTKGKNKKMQQDFLDALVGDVSVEDITSNSAEIFDLDALGQATIPSIVNNLPTYTAGEKGKFIKAVAEAHGGVIGAFSTKMDKYQKQQWINYYNAGNFKDMYNLEVQVGGQNGLSHPFGYMHPGYSGNIETHKVIWGPAVPGEISAGKPVEGTWSSPGTEWSTEEINNFLIKAQMQHPEYLTTAQKRQWVKFHLGGHKSHTDKLSLQAKALYESGAAKVSPALVWTEDIVPAKTYTSMFDSTEFPYSGWTAEKAKDWALDNWEEFKPFLDSTKDEDYHGLYSKESITNDPYTTRHQVEKYFKAKYDEAEAIKLIPIYTKKPVQNVGASTNPVYEYSDQFGNDYFFKPRGTGKMEKYRAEVEHLGNLFGRTFGFSTAKSQVIELDGQYGNLQQNVGGNSDLMGAKYGTLSTVQLTDIANEHVLDWFLDNDDTKGDNAKILPNGHVVGIDKGRSFKGYGGWNGLAGDSKMNTNANTIYSQMYSAIRSGEISKEYADEVYLNSQKRIKKMQKVSQAKIDSMLDEWMKNRESYDVPYFINGKKVDQSLEGLKLAVADRKSKLDSDFTEMWSKIYADAGYGELPELPQGGPLGDVISGLDHAQLHEEVFIAQASGKTTMIGGGHVIGGTVHVWTEKEKKTGNTNVKGELFLGPQKQKDLLGFFNGKVVGGVSKSKSDVDHFNYDTYGSAIVGAAKTINHHFEDKNYNSEKINNFLQASINLKMDTDAWSPTLLSNSEVDGDESFKFPSGANVKMQHVDQYKIMLNHYALQVKEVEDAYANKGKVPILDTYTPVSIDAQGVSFVKDDGSKLSPVQGGFIHSDHTNHTVEFLSDLQASQMLEGQTPWSEVENESAPKTPVADSGIKYSLNPQTHDKTATFDPETNVKTVTENHVDSGAEGQEYEVLLPTGEKIWWRNGNQTGTARGQHGKLTFFVPSTEDPSELALSMDRIKSQLEDMGVPMDAATEQDAELTYWREMFGILANREHNHSGAKPYKLTYAKMQEKYKELNTDEGHFLEKLSASMDQDSEIEYWRGLWSEHFGDKVDKLIENQGYLPKFSHQNYQNADTETGKPYWMRFDESMEDLLDKNVLLVHSYTESHQENIVASGALMSGEERVRQLGMIYVPGAGYGGGSPLQDQGNGSSHQIYSRIYTGDKVVKELKNSSGGYIILEPSSLLKTRTYGLSGDKYGKLASRKDDSPSSAVGMVEKFGQTGHEIMTPNIESFLDDVAMTIFDDWAKREAILQKLKSLGIEMIRGVKIEDRFVMRQDLAKALEEVKKAWAQQDLY